jgi:hypothetical protein
VRVAWLAAWLLTAAACHHGGAPADAPSCAAAADHVRGLLGPSSPRTSRIRDAFAARCEVDGWDVDVRACVVATASLRKPRHCKARLSAEHRVALDRALAAADAPVPLGKLPAVCRDYSALIEKLGGCTGIDDSTRGALEAAYRNLAQAWMRGSYDPPTLELQCRAMTEAVAARCGW